MSGPQPDRRHTLGQHGENWVADRLQAAGYTILARNWRHPDLGELDIVAQEGDEIVFVEVRTRRGAVEAAIEAALSSVDARKQTRLVALAQAYLDAHDLDKTPWRVDVAAVAHQHGKLTLEVVHNAIHW
ncbi:MAG: YraN family protein [Chloroflexi bacterium]|nr:YraN family protein [Chloroflexota bacterium]